MASIIKVDQIQSDTGTVNVTSNVVFTRGIFTGATSNVTIGGATVGPVASSRSTNFVVKAQSTNGATASIQNSAGTKEFRFFIDSSDNCGVATDSGFYMGAQTPTTFTHYGTYGVNLGASTAIPNGTGIRFPSSQSSSSDANTLDDYEEGDWTPAWGSSGSIPTNSPATQIGKYVKIGRVVHFWGRIYMNSWGSGGSGSIRVTGLPITAEDLGGGSSGGSLCHVVWTRSSPGNVAFPTNATQVLGRILPGTTQIEYISMGNADGLGENGTVGWTSNPGMFNNYFAGSYWTAG